MRVSDASRLRAFTGRTSEHSHCLPTACSDLRVKVVAFIQISSLGGQAVDLLRLVLSDFGFRSTPSRLHL